MCARSARTLMRILCSLANALGLRDAIRTAVPSLSVACVSRTFVGVPSLKGRVRTPPIPWTREVP